MESEAERIDSLTFNIPILQYSSIPWLFLSSRNRHHINRLRPAPFQRGGTGIHSGARCHYIVNQQNPFPFQTGKKPSPKSAAHVSRPLGGCQTRLAGCRANAPRRSFLKGELHTPGQCRGQQCRLIETTGAAARGMERNCGNHIEVRLWKFSLNAGQEKRGQIAGHPDGIVVFKIAERGADGSVVANGGAGKIKSGRLPGAGKAGVVVLNIARNRIAATDTERGFDLRSV